MSDDVVIPAFRVPVSVDELKERRTPGPVRVLSRKQVGGMEMVLQECIRGGHLELVVHDRPMRVFRVSYDALHEVFQTAVAAHMMAEDEQ